MDALTESEVQSMMIAGENIVVNSTQDVTNATACLKGIKGLMDKVKESYDPIVDQAHKAHKEAISQRDKYLKPLQESDKKFRAAILVYNQRLESEARERERVANERLQQQAEAQKQALLEKSSESDNEWEKAVLEEKAEEIKPVTVDVQKKVIEQEGLTIAQNWKYEIINEDLIPREYMTPDEIQIGKIARGQKDKASIPGVRFYSAGSVRV